MIIDAQNKYAPGVSHGTGEPALLSEAIDGLDRGDVVSRDELDGDAMPLGLVLGLIDRPHAPRSQLPDDPEPPDSLGPHLTQRIARGRLPRTVFHRLGHDRSVQRRPLRI